MDHTDRNVQLSMACSSLVVVALSLPSLACVIQCILSHGCKLMAIGLLTENVDILHDYSVQAREYTLIRQADNFNRSNPRDIKGIKRVDTEKKG